MPKQFLKFIHISDLHVGQKSSQTKIYQMFEKLNELKLPVIITGDLTENGKFSEIDWLLNTIIEELPNCEVMTTPGNHDYGFKGNIFDPDSYSYFNRRFRGTINATVEDPPLHDHIKVHYDEKQDVVYIGVDSADYKDSEQFARGRISSEALDELKETLDAYKGCFARIVYLHHHPFIRPGMDDLINYPYHWGMELSNSDEFQKVYLENCECLLFGHKHVNEQWSGFVKPHLIHAAGKQTIHLIQFDGFNWSVTNVPY